MKHVSEAQLEAIAQRCIEGLFKGANAADTEKCVQRVLHALRLYGKYRYVEGAELSRLVYGSHGFEWDHADEEYPLCKHCGAAAKDQIHLDPDSPSTQERIAMFRPQLDYLLAEAATLGL